MSSSDELIPYKGYDKVLEALSRETGLLPKYWCYLELYPGGWWSCNCYSSPIAFGVSRRCFWLQHGNRKAIAECLKKIWEDGCELEITENGSRLWRDRPVIKRMGELLNAGST